MNRTSIAQAAVSTLCVPALGVVALAPAADADGQPTCHGRVATIVGTPGDDNLVGTNSWVPDVIVGLGGNDTITGFGGDDLICGDRGNDTIRGGTGRNQIWGGRGDDGVDSPNPGHGPGGSDVVHGGLGSDFIVDFRANDDVHGGRGRDVLWGELRPGSAQVIDGGQGINELYLAVFNFSQHPTDWREHVPVDLARRRIDIDGAVSRFYGRFTTFRAGHGSKTWTVKGTSAPDSIQANGSVHGGEVILRGRAGDDVLVSYDGDDTLYGGAGLDQGYAGPGHDTCFSIESPVETQGATTECEISSP